MMRGLFCLNSTKILCKFQFDRVVYHLMNKRSLGNAYILYEWKKLIDKKKYYVRLNLIELYII